MKVNNPTVAVNTAKKFKFVRNVATEDGDNYFTPPTQNVDTNWLPDVDCYDFIILGPNDGQLHFNLKLLFQKQQFQVKV